MAQQPISLEKPVGEEDDSALADFVEDIAAESPFETASESLRRETVVRVLAVLPRREREVLEMRYGITGGRSRTLEEVGRAFNITRERVRQIENRTLKKLQTLPEAQLLREASLSARLRRRDPLNCVGTHGGVSEWLKETGCKPVGSAYAGSNPAPAMLRCVFSRQLRRLSEGSGRHEREDCDMPEEQVDPLEQDGTQCLVVLQLLRDDHALRWTRGELERELYDVDRGGDRRRARAAVRTGRRASRGRAGVGIRVHPAPGRPRLYLHLSRNRAHLPESGLTLRHPSCHLSSHTGSHRARAPRRPT